MYHESLRYGEISLGLVGFATVCCQDKGVWRVFRYWVVSQTCMLQLVCRDVWQKVVWWVAAQGSRLLSLVVPLCMVSRLG